MKRSLINKIIEETIVYMKQRDIPLPPFAYWTKDEWDKAGDEHQEIIDNMLGWDITDFGMGDFEKNGLTVFTFRNGNFHNKEKYPKPYAEKLLMVREGQILPYHYHWSKMEDIINRGGGDLEIILYNATKHDFENVERGRAGRPGEFDDTLVSVSIDGCRRIMGAGERIVLKPGQSITLEPGVYHTWRGIPGTGDVMLFEVSMTNDDHLDNRFKDSVGRIPKVEEDEAIYHLMFADYGLLND